MKNDVFVARALDIAQNYKTVYANGFIGSPISESMILQKSKQLPSWYTDSRIAMLKGLIGKGYFGFDCVCLVKSILWGWNGDASKPYGGAVYESGGVPDITLEAMIEECSDVSTDFTNISAGEFLQMPGHCGIYVGKGLAVECTTKWEGKVQITAVSNIGTQAGYNARAWTRHGKLPYVEYISAETVPGAADKGGSSGGTDGSGAEVTVTLNTLRKGQDRGSAQIGTAQRILKELGYYKMEVDNSFGPGMYEAVKSFQKAKGLDSDGIVGRNTWNALLK